MREANRRRTGLWLALLIAAGLWIPPSALAARDPTAAERVAITGAAAETEAGPTQRVVVTNIEVSTKGPWAVADVALYLRGVAEVEQEMTDTFYKRGGRWLDTANANTPERTMPAAVESDLGLDDATFGGVPFKVYLYICWFFGLAAIIDVLGQPRAAFARAGHSKAKWLAIEVGLFVVLGVFTWAIYAVRIRPQVVAAGGHPPRRLLRAIRRWLETRPPPPPPPPPDEKAKDKRRQPFEPPKAEIRACTQCNSGKVQCEQCRGGGYDLTRTAPSGQPLPCLGCSSGQRDCDNCRGSGRVSVRFGVETPA
jgi:hypothetical protein